MGTPNGYNNPAYCHQYDSSLYDYQYVPEIDPDSPDLNEDKNRRRQIQQTQQTTLVHPNYQKEFSGSDEFGGSDESNGSIIIEECNNRRVTLICEKRSQVDKNGKGYYNDGNAAKNQQRYHRYEEIPSDDDNYNIVKQSNKKKSIHRYAEILPDENGYPTLKKTIEVNKSHDDDDNDDDDDDDNYSFSKNYNKKNYKPRAVSPNDYSSTVVTPSRRQQNDYHPVMSPSNSISTSPGQMFNNNNNNNNTFIPIKTNSFEMSELSPTRSFDSPKRLLLNQQTFFMRSPKRQPPIGASSVNDNHEPFIVSKCILPSHLQKTKNNKRSHSAPNSPKKYRDLSQHRPSSPNKSTTPFDKKVMQIFHVKSTSGKGKNKTLNDRQNKTARRNISNYFTDPPPTQPLTPRKKSQPEISRIMTRGSPYKPTTTTTTEINPSKTAIITPIFQRKNQTENVSPMRNIQTISKTFQSTGNIFKTINREQNQSFNVSRQQLQQQQQQQPTTRIKRNQSVPNFAHTFMLENGVVVRKSNDIYYNDKNLKTPQKYSSIDNNPVQISPVKNINNNNNNSNNKSRFSFMEDFSSWSNTDDDYYYYHPKFTSTCFMIATIIHLITATGTCAISFYLLSKIGRRYYLDFGLLSGFINFILGLLGFRSYCWRWLPNRNYVTGFVTLAAFSTLTCVGLSYLILMKPMAGDPILDILGGAICAVSVFTIILALTGLTMSGCCKSPPPDNRVNDL
ncbi:conserved hypothetical protein [Pediculus humanus corporis]|uniref:Uncharacterized protein n=1 Tax=Pediculus humanus subsp. corporis TaxID=121224 RepID=E0VBN3_PEDHC|nr:uncharacterized protein Phum_PHUM065540 [Pediculus humanus corporis]EEB10789.1 conserved hypothetical protein [Pediculus humanus corporis]